MARHSVASLVRNVTGLLALWLMSHIVLQFHVVRSLGSHMTPEGSIQRKQRWSLGAEQGAAAAEGSGGGATEASLTQALEPRGVKHVEDIVVAKVSPASSSLDQKKFGIVISDIRPTGESVDWRVLRLLRQVSSTAPGTACEVWVAPGSILPENLQAYLKMRKDLVSVRYMPAVHVNSVGHKIDLHGKHGGHIGKALALRDSSFEFPILLDGDSWPCSGWLGAVKNATLEADVIWSRALVAFGAVEGRNGKTYSSPLIRSQMDTFSHFKERNTGTIFGVRKNPASRRWLTDALDMRANQSAPQHRKHYKGFQDQAAFRESFFLHREELREYLLPLDKACRDPTNSKYQCNNCACACSKCNLIHGKQHFDRCARRTT